MIQLYVNLTRDKTMKKQFLFWLVVTALSIISPATAQENERQGAGGSGDFVDVLIMLLEAGADPNARDENGWTPLHYAAWDNNPDVITVLVEAGIDPNARELDGWTPLHIAAGLSDNPDVITRLIDSGADLEARDVDGWTPLHFAARFNDNSDVFIRLIALGADDKAKTDEGETVWELAGWKMAMQVDMTMTYDPAKKPWDMVLSGPEISAFIAMAYAPCSDEKLDEYTLFNPGCDENSIAFAPLHLLVPMDGTEMPDLLS